MTLRWHEIAETDHRILNPYTHDKLMLLGEICRLHDGVRQLDLACGKGEMLCQWSAHWGIQGVGVDISDVFLGAARARADELRVSDRLQFVKEDAGTYPRKEQAFDIVSCIGATWIGNGLAGTLELLKKALKGRDSLIIVGEPYWIDPPPEAAFTALGMGSADYVSLDGTQERIAAAGLELIEMVLASPDSWDRYEVSQWRTLSDWLRAHPDDGEAGDIGQWLRGNRRAYLQYGRRYLGWGVFVMRLA